VNDYIKKVEESVKISAFKIGKLEPGPLAELRRMKNNLGSPLFWRLASIFPETIGSNKHDEWVVIIRILAILTEKGDPKARGKLHNPNRPLGQVLCDAGNPGNTWPENRTLKPIPKFSEHRFMQLLSSRGKQRAVLVERAARILARTMASGSGLDVTHLAWAILNPENGEILAREYYKRLDQAERAHLEIDKGDIND